ncbi:unnamed protein product [Oikopleura dioica]|nr:unnamed protein product [Oikopleura dioica]
MLSIKNEKSESQTQNSPPKNVKLANHQQTAPKTKSKAGNTMKQRKLEAKANKENGQ